MFAGNSVILDDFTPSSINACCNYYDEHLDKVGLSKSSIEKNNVPHQFPVEDHQINLNKDYFEDLTNYVKFKEIDVCDRRKAGVYERNRKGRTDEDCLLEILNKNGVRCESRAEISRILNKIRNKYTWTPGFSLQLGSKGRKIMLQLLRTAYKSNKKNKRIFQNKNPPTTISNLPFFKISMLWELAYDLGVFEQALLIHELFGNFKKKMLPKDCRGVAVPGYGSEKFQMSNFENKSYVESEVNSRDERDLLEHTPLPYSHSRDFTKRRGVSAPNETPSPPQLLNRKTFVPSVAEKFQPPISPSFTRRCFGGAKPPFPLSHADDSGFFVDGKGLKLLEFGPAKDISTPVNRVGSERLPRGAVFRGRGRGLYLKEGLKSFTPPSALSTDLPSLNDVQINEDDIVMTSRGSKAVTPCYHGCCTFGSH